MHQSAVQCACSAVVVLWFTLTAVTLSAEQLEETRSDTTTIDGVRVQFEDDFSYAGGARQIQVNGQDPQTVGEIHCSMYSYGRIAQPAGGVLKLLMIEDDVSQGPDGLPGVLRMEAASVPFATEYAGFVVYGNREFGDITMPGWSRDKVGIDQLSRTFITFRFRSESHSNPDDLRTDVSFRFEPEMEGSFEWGVDFGTLVATRRWRTMRRPFASARNVEAFLVQINRLRPDRFKLVWRPVDFFDPGDSLLIDDLKITIE